MQLEQRLPVALGKLVHQTTPCRVRESPEQKIELHRQYP
jgi:hypothetical protein